MEFSHFELLVEHVLNSHGITILGLSSLREEFRDEFDGYILAGYEAGHKWPEISHDIKVLFVRCDLSENGLAGVTDEAKEHLLPAARKYKEAKTSGQPSPDDYRNGGGPV